LAERRAIEFCGKSRTPKPEFAVAIHDGCVTCFFVLYKKAFASQRSSNPTAVRENNNKKMESSDAKPNVALKLYYEDGTIRRVTLSREVIASYDAVLESLQKFYNGDVFHPELKLQYVDTEGDKCTISSAMVRALRF
jgi:hypothetical protein